VATEKGEARILVEGAHKAVVALEELVSPKRLSAVVREACLSLHLGADTVRVEPAELEAEALRHAGEPVHRTDNEG
jgi:hypothetical protein